MKKLFVTLLAAILVACLISPWIYWGMEWLIARGVFTSLEGFPFHRYWSRVTQITAIVFCLPFIFKLGIRSMDDVALKRNAYAWHDLIFGVTATIAVAAALGAVYLALGIVEMRHEIAWPKLVKIFFTASAVSCLEEVIFRGVLLGLALRAFTPLGRSPSINSVGHRPTYTPPITTSPERAQSTLGLRPFRACVPGGTYEGRCPSLLIEGLRPNGLNAWKAAIAVSLTFAAVHFLKPAKSQTEHVTWLSGFEQVGAIFAHMPPPELLFWGFCTLFFAGMLFAFVRLKTASLWLAIGIHGGWIMAQQTFNLITRTSSPRLPWGGESLASGVVPTGLLPLLALALVTAVMAWYFGVRTAK